MTTIYYKIYSKTK